MPRELLRNGINVFDFGCGDPFYFKYFLENGVNIKGIDPSKDLIDLGKKRLKEEGYSTDLISIGDVYSMKDINPDSIDLILSLNVLAYLSDEEEREFYIQAKRILREGGYLIVTHSNELFDMFSLNCYTKDFFLNHFNSEVGSLLKETDELNTPKYNIRENPLIYRYKLKSFGFNEIKQSFINFHKSPPKLMTKTNYEQDKFEDNIWKLEEDRWKLMFQCSTFASLSVKI